MVVGEAHGALLDRHVGAAGGFFGSRQHHVTQALVAGAAGVDLGLQAGLLVADGGAGGEELLLGRVRAARKEVNFKSALIGPSENEVGYFFQSCRIFYG